MATEPLSEDCYICHDTYPYCLLCSRCGNRCAPYREATAMRETTHLTPEVIRAMDGPAMTRLAWEWGLAPEGTVWHLRIDTPATPQWNTDNTTAIPWIPHENLALADAVFRSLRTRGWCTANVWWISQREYRGRAEAMSFASGVLITVEYATAAREPLALLRCSVLAVASEREKGGVHDPLG